HRGGIAPFGHPRLSAWLPLPEAFRGAPAPVIGLAGRGIHRVPLLRAFPPTGERAPRRAHHAALPPARPAGRAATAVCRASPVNVPARRGGATGTRTPTLRRARAARSQLRHGPRPAWARLDSNQGPRPYQGRALTG